MTQLFTFMYRLLPALIIYVLWIVTHGIYTNTYQPANTPRPEHWSSPFPCEIHDIDHWSKSLSSFVTRAKLMPCKHSSKLTYVHKGEWLAVNHTVLKREFSEKTMSCTFSSIKRKAHSDNLIIYGSEVPFNLTEQVMMKDGFIRVSCSDIKSKNLIYMNYHTFVLELENVINKTVVYDKAHKGANKEHWNVILLGTDTLSHGDAVRYLVKTRKFLLNELNATEMLGYARLGENTYTNMVPFFTGRRVEEVQKVPTEPLDYLPLIFKNYSTAGYTTLFAEDMPWGATFTYLLPGLNEPPSDYYYRPLSLAVRKDEGKLSWKGCERQGITNKILLDYLKQFVTKFQHGRFLASSFMSELSHDEIFLLRRLDEMYLQVLRYFKQIGVFKNTFLFSYGDHGPRHGSLVKTEIGQLESNTPHLSVVVPAAFAKKYPHYVKNLHTNSRQLTTHFDTHKTLLDILDQANHEEDPTFPNGRNLGLFAEIPKNRTCLTAGVPLVFCVCYIEKEVEVTSAHIKESATFLVNEINSLLPASGICKKLSLETTASAVLYTNSGFKSGMIYKLRFFTLPGHGEFVGVVTVLMDGNVTKLVRQGEITRVNTYGNQPRCTGDRVLKLYCYC